MNEDNDTDNDLVSVIANTANVLAGGIVAVKNAENVVKDAFDGAEKVSTQTQTQTLSPTVMAFGAALVILLGLYIIRKD